MRVRALALAGCCAVLFGLASASLAQVSPEAVQIAGLRKELQRQRKSHEGLKKELRTAQAAISELDQKASAQHEVLTDLRLEVARIWSWGGVGIAILFFVLVIIALRRPPTPSRSDELQQRLAALDHKLRDLSPRN